MWYSVKFYAAECHKKQDKESGVRGILESNEY